MTTDAHSIELRYTCALLAQLVSELQPTRVRIASTSAGVVTSVARYLCLSGGSVVVETADVAAALSTSLDMTVEVRTGSEAPADVAVFPFSVEHGMRPAGEREIVAACYNALSYKTLLHPSTANGTVFQKLSMLRATHDVRPVASLYSPPFIGRLALAKLVERLDSARFFRLEDSAMTRLIDHGAWWRVSYVVVARGRIAS